MQKTISVIDLGAIRKNAEKIKSRLGGKKFFAVVKADAYGHGAEEVAGHIEDIADYFCTAIIEEGISLRLAGITKPVLVFTPPLDCYDVSRAKFYNLELTVNSRQTAMLIDGAPCHIKVNTGMNRLGCSVSELGSVLSALDKESIRGVYSHLYAPEVQSASLKQLALFERAESIVRSANADICAHISASGGFLRGGKFLKDGVRCGILLYGYAPAGFSKNGFYPALKVYARRVQTTKFIGGGIGYNRADRAYKDLSAYRLGYADGFSRTTPLGEKTLCMDGFIYAGDGGETRLIMDDADGYAREMNTISYEVLTSVTRRSQRIYEK